VIFDREAFDDLWPKLDPEEREDLENSLQILTVMIEDLISAKSQLILDFRFNSQHMYFNVHMGGVVSLAMAHGLDFFDELKHLPDSVKELDHSVHESDNLEPTLKVVLIHANSIILRAVDSTFALVGKADLFTEETDRLRRELMFRFSDESSKTYMAFIAVMYLLSGLYDDVADETLPLLVGAVEIYSNSLSAVLTGIDEVVATLNPDKIKLTPIDELFDEPNDD